MITYFDNCSFLEIEYDLENISVTTKYVTAVKNILQCKVSFCLYNRNPFKVYAVIVDACRQANTNDESKPFPFAI